MALLEAAEGCSIARVMPLQALQEAAAAKQLVEAAALFNSCCRDCLKLSSQELNSHSSEEAKRAELRAVEEARSATAEKAQHIPCHESCHVQLDVLRPQGCLPRRLQRRSQAEGPLIVQFAVAPKNVSVSGKDAGFKHVRRPSKLGARQSCGVLASHPMVSGRSRAALGRS